MDTDGGSKGGGAGIIDLEDQLRKKELDALLFPKDAGGGGSSFRGGTRGAKHILSASAFRNKQHERPTPQRPSTVSHAVMLAKKTGEAPEVEIPMARQPVRASTAESFAKRRHPQPPQADHARSDRGVENVTTHRKHTAPAPLTLEECADRRPSITGLTQHVIPGQGVSMRGKGNRAPGSAAGNRKKKSAGGHTIEGFVVESPRQAVAAALANDAANQGRLPPSRRSSKVANWNAITERLGGGGGGSSVSDPGFMVVDGGDSSSAPQTASTRLNLRNWGFSNTDFTPGGTPRSQLSSRGAQQGLPITPPTPPSGPSLRPTSLPSHPHRSDPSYRSDTVTRSPRKRCSTAPAVDSNIPDAHLMASSSSSPQGRRHGGRRAGSALVPTSSWNAPLSSPLAAVHEEFSDVDESPNTRGCRGATALHPITVFELPLHRVTVASEVEGLSPPSSSSGPAWARETHSQNKGNPFDSVDDGDILGTDEMARPPLEIRLPVDAASSSGTADVIADLFGLLNDIRSHCEADPSSTTDAVAGAGLASPQRTTKPAPMSLAGSRESSPFRQRPVGDALRGSLLQLLMTSKPSGRAHATMVAEWFDTRSRRILAGNRHSSQSTSKAATRPRSSPAVPEWLHEGTSEEWSEVMQVCGTAMATFVQQVGMHCYERGAGMAKIWNLYTELHDARVQHLRDKLRVSEEGRLRAEAEASQFRSDSGAFHASQRGMAEVVEENTTMQAQLAFMGGERDDLLSRVMKLEDEAAAADLRNSRLHTLKSWTLKKFVGVTTDKLGLRTREIERLNRDLMLIRMQHEGLNKALPFIADGLNELEDQLRAEPKENPMRIALAMATYGNKQVLETAKTLGQLDDAAQEDHGSEMAAALTGNGLDNDSFYDLMKATVDMFDLDLDIADLEQRLLGDQEISEYEQQGESPNDGDPALASGMAGAAGTASESADTEGPTRMASVTFKGAPRPEPSSTVPSQNRKAVMASSATDDIASSKSGGSRSTVSPAHRTSSVASQSLEAGREQQAAFLPKRSTSRAVSGAGVGNRKGEGQLGATLSSISRHFNRSATLSEARSLSRPSALSRKRSTEVDIDMTDVVEMDHESCMKEIARLRRMVWALETDDGARSSEALRVSPTRASAGPPAPHLVNIGSIPSLPRASSRFMGDAASTTSAELEPDGRPGSSSLVSDVVAAVIADDSEGVTTSSDAAMEMHFPLPAQPNDVLETEHSAAEGDDALE